MQEVLLYGILGGLFILLVLVLVLIFTSRPKDLSTKIDASLRDQFLNFQTNLYKEFSTTKDEFSRSKDVISDHTLKTIETIKDMGTTIHKIIQQQEEAQKLGQSLNYLLQAPKLRGSYGEEVLEEMLDKVLPKGFWGRQYSIAGNEKVDAVIKYRDLVVPIDAKFPREDYLRYLEATTDGERSKYWKDYEKAIINQMKSIKDKYIKPELGTSDFALMFIPSEGIYYETIAERNHLGETSKIFEYARESKVIPISPNNFYVYLQVILMGIRNIEIMKNASKLQENLFALQNHFSSFYKKYEEIGKSIEKAQETYKSSVNAVEKYKKQLDKTLELEGLAVETETNDNNKLF